MKKIKQVLACSVASVLIAGTVGGTQQAVNTASANSKQNSYAVPANEETLDVYSESSNNTGMITGWYAKILKDKFNVKVNIIGLNGNPAVFYTRAASHNLGDICIINDAARFTEAIKDGLLVNMNSLTSKYGTYVTKNYSKAINYVKSAYGGGSALYGITASVSKKPATESADLGDINTGNYMLWSAYKKAGMPKINSLDDLVNVVAKMQKARPKSDTGHKTYGWSPFKDWDGSACTCPGAYTGIYGYDQLGFNLVSANGQKLQSIFTKGGLYYNALKLYFHANQKGLLDPDSYSQNYSSMAAKYTTGQTLTANFWWECQTQYNSTKNSSGVLHASKANKVSKTGVSGPDGYVFVPIKGENCLSNGFTPAGSTSTFFSIGTQCQDQARCMQIINWLYSPEGMENLNGPKGLVWVQDPKTKKDKLTPYGEKAADEQAAKTLAVPAEYGGGLYGASGANWGTSPVNGSDIDPNTNEPYNRFYWSSYLNNHANTDLVKEWSKKIGLGTMNSVEFLKKTKTLAVEPGVAVKRDPTLSTILADKMNMIKTVVHTYSWQCMMAKTNVQFNNAWTTLVTKAKALGLSDVDSAYQAQYKLYKKACYDAQH